MGEFGVVFQNEPVDVSEEFSRQENHFFVGDRIDEFDPESASGKICWGTGDSAEGCFCHPEDGGLHVLRLLRGDNGFDLGEDPLGGRVNWRISTAP